MSTNKDSNFGLLQRSELWLSVTFLITLVVLIVPLPTFLLDMFLACNIAAAIRDCLIQQTQRIAQIAIGGTCQKIQ